MAPNKFEKHIKKQLEEREIQPSIKAWARVSAKLDAAAPQSKKKGYLWYGIAASVIGLLIVSVLYFNSEGFESIPEIQVVDTHEDTNSKSIHIDSSIEKSIEVKVVESDNIVLSVVENKLIEKKEPLLVNDEITFIEENISLTQKPIASEGFEDEIINSKLLEIVAVVDSLEQNSIKLTDAEVDVLLRDAQQEILNDKRFHKNGAIDAIALLTEVEVELDQSFRDKVFDNLKEGFQKVRTAVANRNN